MKHVIIFLLAINIIIAQDHEVSKMKFNYQMNGNTYTNEPLHRDSLIPKNFVITTQWGGHPRMLNALKFNYNQGWAPSYGNGDSTYLPNNTETPKLTHIWNYRYEAEASLGFIYEPTLYIPPNRRGEFITKANDATKAIWGFSHRLGDTLQDSVNFDRLVLYKTAAYKDSIVLKNTWINHLFYVNNEASPAGDLFNGLKWNFSINLRRLNQNEHSSPDTILVIKLPFINKKSSTVYDSGYVKFSKLPRTSINSTNIDALNYYENLGNALKMDSDTNSQQRIVILNSMIPDSLWIASGNKKDITINAEFNLDGIQNINPKLKTDKNGLGIDTLDIEVKYFGNNDIAIDNMSIGTPTFRKFFEGQYDNQAHIIANKGFQTMIDSGYNVGLMYSKDEHGESSFNACRRNARMFNFCTVNEGAGGDHPKQYAYHEEVTNIWEGAAGIHDRCAVPFAKRNINGNNQLEKDSIYYRLGYAHGIGDPDSLNSYYETYLNIWKDIHRVTMDSVPGWASDPLLSYQKLALNAEQVQVHIEGTNYGEFYSDYSHIYDNKAWWQNMYLGGNWKSVQIGTHKYYASFIYKRPETGEEARWNIWRALVYGAKGLAYDGHCQKYPLLDTGASGDPLSLQFLDNENDTLRKRYDTASVNTLLFSKDPAFGVDFIPERDSSTNIDKYINFERTTHYLGVMKNRIYYGRKSPKIEMYKANSFIKNPENEDVLLNLHIISALGKGYRCWHTWDTTNYGASDPLKKVMNFDTDHIFYDPQDTNKTLSSKYIKTRPIGRVKSGGEPFYEPWDSSFFDLTLHKYKNKSTDTVFYLALQNRRSDPLFMADFNNGETFNQLYFSPSAEFEAAMLKGDSTYPFVPETSSSSIKSQWRDSSWWRNHYWAKQGIREITIPFNFKPVNSYDYCLLHVKEMYDTSAYAVNLRNVSKTTLIDTVIGQDSPLALNFQPGEGKFLKVNVIYPQTNIVGKLDHSNQNKFCEYTDTATKKTTFYATYFSGDSVPINFLKKFVNRVYIVQSYPTFRDSGNTIGAPNVRWYSPVLLSNFITDGANTRVNYNCTHPSLVIGRDTLGNRRAYVAYQCNDTVPTVPTKLMIVESVVKLFDDMSPMSIISSTRIGDAYYDTLYGIKEYGNPVINYSDQGNFYAWSTAFCPTLSNDGIIFGFKKRGETYLQSTGKITPQMLNAPPMSRSYFRHPGLNPYSVVQAKNSSNNETEAMLAFQMANTSNSSWGVANDFLYYTKLILDANSKVTHTLGNYYTNRGIGWDKDTNAIVFVNNDSIMKFKWAARMANKPACFSVPDSLISSGNEFRYKAIYFERRYWPGISQLVGFNILERPRKYGFSWYIQSVARISPIDTSIQDLGYPHLGNAEEIKFNTSGVQVRNGLGLLNFTWGDKIYHYPVSDTCKISNDGFSSEEELASKLSYVADGKLPHLVNSPFKHSFNDIWRNRRIFNTFGTNEKIVPSSRYFYKKNSNGDEVTALYGFDADTISCKLGKSYFDGNELQLKLPYSLVDSSYKQNNSDTIYSNWFTVNTASQLSFVYRARHFSSHYLSYIERRDSLSHINIPLNDISDSCISLVNVNLTNGGGHEYRYVLLRLDTISRYTEEMLLGNIKFKDTLFYKTQGRHSGFNIDLGGGIANNLRVTPNPATDQILVNIGILDNENLESKFRLLISNNAGQVLFEKDVSQQTIENIGISDFSNGSYNVSIYSKSWNGSKLPLARTMFAKVK